MFRWIAYKVKIDFDGGMASKKADCAFDKHWVVLSQVHTQWFRSNVVLAELQGLWEGVRVAREFSPHAKIWVEGIGSSSLILCYYFSSSIRCLPIFRDMKDILSQAAGWRVSHIFREGNKLADRLVGRAISMEENKLSSRQSLLIYVI